MKIELIPIIAVIAIIPTLMFLATYDAEPLQQEIPSCHDSQMMLNAISHYAENGFDEICIEDGDFTFCAIEQKKWKIWKNSPVKELTLRINVLAVSLGYDEYPIPGKLIKSEETMGNFTSYYNRCANIITVENNRQSNQLCSDSVQIFFDKLTKSMLVNDTEFLITISPVYKMPHGVESNGFGLDFFDESKKRFKHLVETASTMDGFVLK